MTDNDKVKLLMVVASCGDLELSRRALSFTKEAVEQAKESDPNYARLLVEAQRIGEGVRKLTIPPGMGG